MYDRKLVQCLLADSPQEIVLIGEPVFRLEEALTEPSSDSGASTVHRSQSIDEFVSHHQADATNTIKRATCLHLPDNAVQPDTLLGLACRTSPRLLLVEHAQVSADGDLLEDERFFAFGFRFIEATTCNSGRQRRLFGYRLSDYKQAPTWLNARFWANPERFDLQD